MNREEIEAEISSIDSSRFESLHARPAVTAWLEHRNGLPIDQTCPYCQELLSAADDGDVCTVNCLCGKSKSNFPGT
jgi:hypothetical protein